MEHTRRVSGRFPRENDIPGRTERQVRQPMEGATHVKAEKGGRTKNIPETAKCEVHRGMGGGGVCAEKGEGREGPQKVYD